MDKAKLSRMQTLCSKKEYSPKQITEKLLKAGLSGEEAAEIVASLKRDKYLDENRFARAYVRDKAILGGWGDAKITFMLHGEGIPQEAIDAAFEELSESDREKKVLKALETKYKTLKDTPEARLKLIRFGLSRGFSYDYINPLICRLLAEKE